MRIIFNTDQIYLHGGIEKVMAEKANYFAQLPNAEVYIVTTEQESKPPCYPLDDNVKLIDLGINYNRQKSYFSAENLKKAILHFLRQKALFKKLQANVIISPNFNFDHYWLPFIKGKAKLIKERHSSRFYEEDQRKNGSFNKKLRYKFNDWIEKKYNHIVLLNPDEKLYVKTGNAVVIPNPVEIGPEIASLDNNVILAAGRISPVKAFDELIRSFALIAPEFPDWELHIYGDNYLNTREKLEILVKELNLEKQVKFKGSIPNLKEAMLNASIYAMTSQTECFPMVLLESLSVGLPIVSYDAPNGPRHILTDGEDGFMVNTKDQKQMAESLKKLMQNPQLRKEMGRKAKENGQRFEKSKVMKKWQEFLDLSDV